QRAKACISTLVISFVCSRSLAICLKTFFASLDNQEGGLTLSSFGLRRSSAVLRASISALVSRFLLPSMRCNAIGIAFRGIYPTPFQAESRILCEVGRSEERRVGEEM